MGHDETLAGKPAVSSCPVCGSDTCAQFHVPPYPDVYPFLPGGYDPNAADTVEPVQPRGARSGKGMRWRS